MLVEGDTGLGSVIGEGAVAVVEKQDARGGVASDIDVLPAVAVEVRRRRRKGIVIAHITHSGGITDILEPAIAEIAVEGDVAEREAARTAIDRHALPFAV